MCTLITFILLLLKFAVHLFYSREILCQNKSMLFPIYRHKIIQHRILCQHFRCVISFGCDPLSHSKHLTDATYLEHHFKIVVTFMALSVSE